MIHHVDDLLRRAASGRGGELRIQLRAPVVDERLHAFIRHFGIVAVACKNRIPVRIIEDFGDLRGNAHGRIAVAQPHEQAQVERIVELAPFRDIAFVEQVTLGAG